MSYIEQLQGLLSGAGQSVQDPMSRFTQPDMSIFGPAGQNLVPSRGFMGPSTTGNQAATTQAIGASHDRATRIREAMKGLGETVDQLGSAFDQRLQNIVIPNRTAFDWSPNVNPGIAGMVQQLLLASARR